MVTLRSGCTYQLLKAQVLALAKVLVCPSRRVPMYRLTNSDYLDFLPVHRHGPAGCIYVCVCLWTFEWREAVCSSISTDNPFTPSKATTLLYGRLDKDGWVRFITLVEYLLRETKR
jgi:hypothetical protein